jgi:uncharacterized protein
MPTIDADTHVIETERTWEYITGAEVEYRPGAVDERAPDGTLKQYFVIDGRRFPRRSNIGLDTTEATREMSDVQARLRHMDELSVDIHVLYPTIFLRPLTEKPEVELALCHGYNRWLADLWAEGNGRLRWAAVLPLMSMERALEELRWARERGACAVFLRGLEVERRLSDPYFFPLFELASELDVPLGIHSATGSFTVHDFFGADEPGFNKFKLAVVGAFHSIVYHKIPERFPRLRTAFVEVAAQWAPYVVRDLATRFRRRGEQLPDDLFRAYRLYIACQTDDDLSYVLQTTGPDSLIIGSDYGHADTSSELEALRNLKRSGGVDPAWIDRILTSNPARLYAL